MENLDPYPGYDTKRLTWEGHEGLSYGFQIIVNYSINTIGMPFVKGESGNPNGRPKGSENKSSQLLRERISTLLEDQYEFVLEDIKQLKPKERVDAWLKLLEYAVPKLQRTEIKSLTTVEELLTMSPKERQERLLYLKSKLS